ncbi:amidohydrolase family protein [Leucobacter sp. GX24907]
MTASPLILRNARVLDVRSGEYREADVVMNEGRIESIGSAGSLPAEAEEVNAAGKYLLPGLIDGHVHVAASTAALGALETMSPSYVGLTASRMMKQMLRRGFTSVRDAGGGDFGLARAQEEGLITGSRLFYSGSALSQTGGHGDFRDAGDNSRVHCCSHVGRIADGVPAVREAAREEIRKGATQIKIMASGGIASLTDRIDSTQFSAEEISAAVEEAEAANLYVMAHAYTPRAVNRCLELGVRSIEHGNRIDQSSIDLFLEKDAYLVPTLSTHWALVDEGLKFGMPRDAWEKVGTIFEEGLENTRLAAQAGVNIAFATDLLGGMQRHQGYEFEIRARVQSNLDVVRSATVVAAEMMQQSGQLGELVEGAVADAVLLDSDPLADISVLSNFEERGGQVIQAGVLV